MSVRVLVVDDQAVVRAGFAAVIGAEPDLTVAAEAGDGAEALRLARTTAPDVVRSWTSGCGAWTAWPPPGS